MKIFQESSSRWAIDWLAGRGAHRLAESGQRQALSHWSSLDLTFLAFRWATVWLAGRGARRLAELGASPGAWPLGRRSGRKSNKALGELRLRWARGGAPGENGGAARRFGADLSIILTSWKGNLHYLALNTRP